MGTTEIVIQRTDGPFGAVVHGVDLREDVHPSTAERLREAWLEHQVLVFPEQVLDLEQLEAGRATH